MALLNLDSHQPKPAAFSLFNLAFRPFFLGGSLFAAFTMLTWLLLYQGTITLNLGQLSAMQWHAHEMVFGFTTAIATGFLLTALKNWTNQQTPFGWALVGLFGLWLLARLSWYLGPDWLWFTAATDLLYNLFFAIAFALPVIKTRQWKQAGLLSKVILMGLLNALFYLQLLGFIAPTTLEKGLSWAIYGGFFVILALVLTMARRVIPFFIEKGVRSKTPLSNPAWIDYSSLGLFVLFASSEVFLNTPLLSALSAGLLTLVMLVRLKNWYRKGIWRSPMLWSLYLAMSFVTFGFLLYSLMPFAPQLKYLALHALAVGGMSLVITGMMTRVSLGHTGRNILQPPKATIWLMLILISAAAVRVIFPLLDMQNYPLWMTLSQLLWISAFLLFAVSYSPMLIKKRLDGHFG